jgi:hypothetical protein
MTDSAIALAWTAVPGATSYEVFREDPGQTDFHSLGAIKGLSFGNAGLKAKTSYRYQVRPILASGPGAFTAPLTEATHTAVPRCIDPGTCKVE